MKWWFFLYYGCCIGFGSMIPLGVNFYYGRLKRDLARLPMPKTRVLRFLRMKMDMISFDEEGNGGKVQLERLVGHAFERYEKWSFVWVFFALFSVIPNIGILGLYIGKYWSTIITWDVVVSSLLLGTSVCLFLALWAQLLQLEEKRAWLKERIVQEMLFAGNGTIMNEKNGLKEEGSASGRYEWEGRRKRTTEDRLAGNLFDYLG